MNTELPKNFVVVDCETSGLNPKVHSLLSIGAVTIGGGSFYAECAPWDGAGFDPEAMAVNGMDWEECKARRVPNTNNRIYPSTIVMQLIAWLKVEAEKAGLSPETGWIMGGKNPQFDYRFLLESLRGIWLDSNECAKKLNISRRCIDLHSLAYWWGIQNGIDFGAKDFSTDTIYEALGFSKEPMPHHALIGAGLELDVFRKLFDASQATEVKP